MVPAVAGVLLAAGAGRRAGGPKALVVYDGRPLVLRGVDVLREGGCDRVVAVVGAEATRVAANVPGSVHVVVNRRWQTGMASTVRVGLKSLLPTNAHAAVIALVDQPLIGADAVARLIAAWRSGAIAAVATYEGEPRNPVVLDRRLWPEVMHHVHGDAGARHWLRSRPDLVTDVPCDDVASCVDIDSAGDVARLGARQG